MCNQRAGYGSASMLWQALIRYLSAWPPLIHAHGIRTVLGTKTGKSVARTETHRPRIYW
jgi:hypothetical protein